MGHDITAYRHRTKEDFEALESYEVGSRPCLERVVERVKAESGEDSDIYRLGLQRLQEWDNYTISPKCDYEIGYIGGHGDKIEVFYHAVGKPEMYVTCSGIGNFTLTKVDLPTLEDGIEQLKLREDDPGHGFTLRFVEAIYQALQHLLMPGVRVETC